MEHMVFMSPADLKELVSNAVREAITMVSHGVGHADPLAGKVWLSEREAASILGTTAASLRSKRSRGKGPVYCKDGGRIVYDRREIDAYLKARKVKTREY